MGSRIKRSLMKKYNLSAPVYDRLYYEEQMSKYVEGLRMLPPINSSVILDAGCGSGIFLEKLSGSVNLAVGLDFSKSMVKLARNRTRMKNAEFIIGDVESMPLRDSIFDVVFMFTVLNNTPRPLQALREVRRVLKEEGYLVVSFLKKSFTEEIAKTLLDESKFRVVDYSGEKTNDYIFICLKKSFYSPSP